MRFFWSPYKMAEPPSPQPRQSKYIPPVKRVAPDWSHVELTGRKREVGRELKARVYLYDDAKLIVTSCSGIAESGTPTVFPLDVGNSELGLCICDHLLSFTPESPNNMRDRKMTDWPAYKASGAKSVRSFQEKTWLMSVSTINLVIRMEAGPINSLWPEIEAQGICNPVHEKMGEIVQRTFRGAKAMREQGII